MSAAGVRGTKEGPVRCNIAIAACRRSIWTLLHRASGEGNNGAHVVQPHCNANAYDHKSAKQQWRRAVLRGPSTETPGGGSSTTTSISTPVQAQGSNRMHLGSTCTEEQRCNPGLTRIHVKRSALGQKRG